MSARGLVRLSTLAAFAGALLALPGPALASPWAIHPVAPRGPKAPAPEPPVAPTNVVEPEPTPSSDAGTPTRGETRVIHVHSRADGRTASSRRIGAATISTTPKRSAEDLLRLVPGMLIVQHGNQGKGYQFYVRGFDAVHGSDVELMLDDVPLNEPSNIHAHGYLDPAFIIPEVVREVSADKGAFRLEQGNFATAASIRYRLGVSQVDRGTRIGYEVGTTNRHRAVVVHAPKRRSEETFVAVEALYDRGYGDNRRARRASAMGQVRLFDRGGTTIDALGTVYTADFGLPGTVRLGDWKSGEVGFYDAYSQDTGGGSSRAIAALRLDRRTDRGKLHVGLWGQGRRLRLDENYTGDLLFPGIGDRHLQREDRAAVGLVADWERALGRITTLRIVGNWRLDGIDQHEDRLREDGTAWASSRDQAVVQQTFGIAPGLRLTPTPWLMLEGGTRVDVFDYWVQDRMNAGRRFHGLAVQASPRFVSRFTIREKWQLFAAYGRGLRSPEARAFTLPTEVPENTDVDRFAGGKPRMTVTDNVELGARFEPNDTFDVGTALYGIWIARESIFDHVSGFNVELDATQRLGVEADLQVHPTRWLDLGIDLTYVDARFRKSGEPVPGAPPLLVQVHGSLTHPKGWRAGLRWFVMGPRPLSYGAKAGATTVLDLSVGYRHRHFQIDAIVDNVIATKWREGEYNFASHWNPDERASQLPSIHYVAGPPITARLAASVFF